MSSSHVRKAVHAALKDPALIRRAAKGAAESYVHGLAYRETSKMREEDEAAEAEAAPASPRKTTGNVRASPAVAGPSRTIAPAQTTSPAGMAASRLGRK